MRQTAMGNGGVCADACRHHFFVVSVDFELERKRPAMEFSDGSDRGMGDVDDHRLVAKDHRAACHCRCMDGVTHGFFCGWMDHGFSGVLYSDSLPRGQITTVEGTRRISGWGDLHVPFPNERRTLRMYFEQSSKAGDFLHISDPRYFLDDQFFVLSNSSAALEISEMEFYSGAAAISEGPGFGVGLDELRAIFGLRQAGVKMLRRKPGMPIYAVVFTPQNYEPALLESLKGLPNIQQIQLAGTAVSDLELASLRGLRMLTGIGLDQTDVTDERDSFTTRITVSCDH